MSLQKNIIELQSKIVNYALIVYSLFAVVIQFIAFIRVLNYGYSNIFMIQSFVMVYLIIVTAFRKKISNELKVYTLVIGVIVTLSSGVYGYGLLAPGKVYIIAIAVVVAFVFSYKRSITITLLLVLNYAVFAYLYSTGKLTYDFNINDFVSDASIWILDLMVLFSMSLALQFISFKFKLNFINSYDKIEAQNRELKESEEKYRKLVEAYPDIIMVSDLKGNIIFGNDNLVKITGITEEDYSNRSRNARIHPDDYNLVRNTLTDLIKSDATQSPLIENRFIDTWGKEHWFSGTMSKIKMNSETYIQTVSRDITERKKTEMELDNYRKNLEKLVKEKTNDLELTNKELKATNQELSEKNSLIKKQYDELKTALQHLKETQAQLLQAEKMASLGTLTAGVAHEINNPLNFILGAYSGLKKHLVHADKKHKEEIEILLNSLKTGVDRASNIVKSLNQFSRSSEDNYEDCNLHEILENCLLMIRNQYKHKIEIVKNFDVKPVPVRGNEGKLHQVFLNIVINAAQAIANKGKIIITSSFTDTQAIIEIADTGEGIKPEHLPKITDPFFTTKPPGKGTGLGLSITYKIIKEHKGELEFESEPGRGTIVRVKIPLTIDL